MADTTEKTTTTTDTTSDTTSTTNTNGLNDYNTNRIQQINDMYAKQKDSSLSQLKTAYDQNISDLQAAYDKITPQYQNSMNQASAEYERQRRNNNMAAAGNGLNTGAGSQMNLAQAASYQSNQAGLQKQMNESLDEANRNITDTKTKYQNDMATAINNNDYQLAAALLDEYGNQYARQSEQAKAMAEFGDFSGYVGLWSQDQIDAAAKSWALQNPDLAYNTGKITADEYFGMTGKWPHGYNSGSSSSGGGGGSSAYYGTPKYWVNGDWTSVNPASKDYSTIQEAARTVDIARNTAPQNDVEEGKDGYKTAAWKMGSYDR